jgi:putative addiction module killer protein
MAKCLFSIGLIALDPFTKELVHDRLEIAKTGYFGDYKNLGDGVFELRIHFGCGYRIYFGKDGMGIVLLLCGGEKNTQDKDIKKAKFFWEDYKNAQKK